MLPASNTQHPNSVYYTMFNITRVKYKSNMAWRWLQPGLSERETCSRTLSAIFQLMNKIIAAYP